jgi:hypothetical protein
MQLDRTARKHLVRSSEIALMSLISHLKEEKNNEEVENTVA